MIGMGVVEADDVEPTLAGLALSAYQVARVDIVARLWGIGADIVAADCGLHGSNIAFRRAYQDAATLVGVSLYAVTTYFVVLGSLEFQHLVAPDHCYRPLGEPVSQVGPSGV